MMLKIWLSFLNKYNKQNSSGFTLIELLVVIIILGILITFSLGSIFSLIGKAQRVEAINDMNTCGKNQLAYYAENSQFTDSLELLRIPKESKNYTYEIVIYPPTQPEDGNQGSACCLATDKGGEKKLVFYCASTGS